MALLIELSAEGEASLTLLRKVAHQNPEVVTEYRQGWNPCRMGSTSKPRRARRGDGIQAGVKPCRYSFAPSGLWLRTLLQGFYPCLYSVTPSGFIRAIHFGEMCIKSSPFKGRGRGGVSIVIMLTAKSRQDANKNGTVPDSHRESKNRPVITKVGNGLRAETVPKGRQSTAGGETPGKVGGLQALKGRRNTSRDFTPGCTLTSRRDCSNHRKQKSRKLLASGSL